MTSKNKRPKKSQPKEEISEIVTCKECGTKKRIHMDYEQCNECGAVLRLPWFEYPNDEDEEDKY